MKISKKLILLGLLLALTFFLSGCTAVLTTKNQTPTAKFTPSPERGEAPLTVTFDASNSSDDGEIIQYKWDFKDGTTKTGKVVTHTFGDDGDYYVKLTVRDDEGASSSVTTRIKVLNPAPQAKINHSPKIPIRGESVTFDAGYSVDPAVSTEPKWIKSYHWDFGDGTSATGMTVSKRYNTPGFYNVKLTVTDDDNASSTITEEIEIEAPPIAKFEWNVQKVSCRGAPLDNSSQLVPIECYAKVKFNAGKSSDPQGDIVDYHWNVPDYQSFYSRSFTIWLPWTKPTSTNVTLTVTDDHGLSDSVTKRVGKDYS
ncbi:MAG: PKD domain-containing protein [Candidatus Paceibacterota bacterium]